MRYIHLLTCGIATVLFCCLFLTQAGCGNSARSSEVQSLTLSTLDGYTLPAKCYLPGKLPAPGLILVHRAGQDLTSWDSFALQAQARGYCCISFTLRGHANTHSENNEQANYRNFSAEAWMGGLRDIAAAKEALLKAGADRENLVILGEAIGSSLALHYAVKDPDLQGAVLLSPGMDYRGVTIEATMLESKEFPVLLVASKNDDYAAAAANTLKAVAPGFCELRLYPGVAHGTALFEGSANTLAQIFLWLDIILGEIQ